ncbi:MAG: hypothetical protein PWP23_857 [Candidatus Sumerlaeota bacterium]|nr:hypothetical protein [Candidatus Sumerlaeota bacterium]
MSKDADLYQRELDRYRGQIANEPQNALTRYGMTLINSLNPADRALALKQWGIEITEPIDYYNLGVKFAQEENWSEAILYFKRSVELDPELTDAIYNLAICYEKTGHTPQARSTWEVYIGSVGDSSETFRVKEHLKELE